MQFFSTIEEKLNKSTNQTLQKARFAKQIDGQTLKN